MIPKIAFAIMVSGVGLWVLGLAWAAPPDRDPEPGGKGREALEARLARIRGAEKARRDRVADHAVRRMFPSDQFFAVRFMRYPRAQPVPPSLKHENLFMVRPDGTVRHMEDAKALEEVFRSSLAPVKDEAQAREAVMAWLRLVETFHQDGYYRFTIPEGSVSVRSKDGAMIASGKALVVQGGKGALDATLTFDPAGKLVSVDNTGQVRRGVRPICQATKLLDPDPIVRRMAEQDLLVMGRAAEGYLKEQRARAAPELRRAIDRIWERIVAEGW